LRRLASGDPLKGRSLIWGRVRVYPDQTLRAKVKADFPSAIEWAPGRPLLGRSAFVASGKRIVGHGGISLRSWFAAQAQRRIKEQGEREAVSRAARRVLRCFVDWGVLQDTSEKGVSIRPNSIEDKKLAAWLIEAALVASDLIWGAQSDRPNPALFPLPMSQSIFG